MVGYRFYPVFSSSMSLKCSSLKLLQYSKRWSLPALSAEAPGCWGCPVSQAWSMLPPEKEYCFGDPWCLLGIPLFFLLFSNVLWPAQIPATSNNHFCFPEACQISSSRKSLICSVSWYFSFTLSVCQYCLRSENIILLP